MWKCVAIFCKFFLQEPSPYGPEVRKELCKGAISRVFRVESVCKSFKESLNRNNGRGKKSLAVFYGIKDFFVCGGSWDKGLILSSILAWGNIALKS